MSKIIINGKSDGALKAYKGDDGIAAMCAGDSLAYTRMETGTQPEPPATRDYLCLQYTETGYSNNTFMAMYHNMGEYDPELEYSFDKENWWAVPNGRNVKVTSSDRKVYLRSKLPICRDDFHYIRLDMNRKFIVSGHVASVLGYENMDSITSIPDYGLYFLFASSNKLTDASQLDFSGIESVGIYGCKQMFQNCTALTQAPATLPAATLANSCYVYMFSGCTALTTAPALPATTLAASCYAYMFENCTNLTTAPALPATTLAISCYAYMFCECGKLTTAPELPATTLAGSCYESMFVDCASLTTAPELPATTLVASCYYNMFFGASINTVKCLAEDISAPFCTFYWLESVSASGTFIKSPNMSSWPTGYGGIPSGWTVVDAS